MISHKFSAKFVRFGLYLGLCLLCFAFTISCNREEAKIDRNAVIQNNRVSIGTTLKPRTLDPADNYELAGLNIIYNVGESLYTYELGTTEIKPLLATQMPSISENGLIYKIPLRNGVKFQDGTPFNAEAMEFSLNRFIANGGKPAFLLGDVVQEIKATEEYELTITLKQPFSAFPALLAFPGACAVSPQAYKIGAGEFNPNTLIGTGKYTLTKFGSDAIALDVNDNYWGEKPANNGINMQIYAGNSANLFNSFRTGAVDVAYQSLDPNQIESLLKGAEQDKWQVTEGSGTNVSYLTLNLQQEPLNKPEVRKAIAALIDRTLINQRVLQGQGEAVYSMIPTAFEVYQPAFQNIYGDADIARAKDLLVQAGYSSTNPAVVEIWYPSGSITREIVAETLKAFAEQKLEGAIRFVPSSVESASFFGNLGKGIYQAALVDWYPDFLDADNYIQPFLSCNEGSDTTGCTNGAAQSRGSFYYSDVANNLIKEQRQATEPEARQTVFSRLQETLAEDVPYVPLWQNTDYAFAQNNIAGVTLNPSQNFPFWTIEKQ